jgi:hypothetical protein
MVRDARPFESAPANADAIANGESASLNQVEEMRLRIDHDGAGRLCSVCPNPSAR